MIRRILLRLLGGPVVVDASTAPPEWLPSDAERLRAFFKTESGSKLVTMLRQLTVRESLSAIHAEAGKLPWASGKAAGVVQMVQMLDRMALVAEPEAPVGPGIPTDDLGWLNHERNDETGGR